MTDFDFTMSRINAPRDVGTMNVPTFRLNFDDDDDWASRRRCRDRDKPRPTTADAPGAKANTHLKQWQRASFATVLASVRVQVENLASSLNLRYRFRSWGIRLGRNNLLAESNTYCRMPSCA